MGERVDPDAAHRVVRGWRNLHRFTRDINPDGPELFVHARQTGMDDFACQAAYVQPDAAVLAATTGHDFAIVRQRHPVAA